MSAIQLKEHQVDQKAAFRKWVGFPARSSVPPEGARGTIVSATGSGKTITAAACALECFPGGRILVTVPTLDLLVQTAQAWRLVGHRAPMVAVCSLENDPVLNELGVRTTTNPIQLALWAGKGPVVVFATYPRWWTARTSTHLRGSGGFAGRWRPLWRAETGSTASAWLRSTSRSWMRRTEPPVILVVRGRRSTTTPVSRRTSGST
ncbi:hypothetical protein GCM10010423_69190 [Streptomyces levis]|uniref:Helicase/UvrB N-terminal domain-containing protein n=1 Tax=Streptomyces levis TaxID=285566 RepID=A0ABN3P2E1_9ACTN